MPTSLHGAISAHEHPNAAGKLAVGQQPPTLSGTVFTRPGAWVTMA